MTTKPVTTGPLTAHELRNDALAAVPGYPELVAAMAAVDERLTELRATPGPPVPTIAELAGSLIRSEPLPEPGDLGATILEAEQHTAAMRHETELLTRVHDELHRTLQVTLQGGGAAAFQWLHERLLQLLDRGRAILERLGDVRTAETALDSERPAEARDALRELRALAAEYAALREAQALLVGDAVGYDRHQQNGGLLTWTGQVQLVREHGTVENPREGAPPADPYTQLVWLLDRPAARPFVPGFAELCRRADAARPPTAAAPMGPGYSGAPGEYEQRTARLRRQHERTAST